MRYRLEPDQAIRERLLKCVVDIMRIAPYQPIKLADELYNFVINHVSANPTTVFPPASIDPKTLKLVKELEELL